MRRATDWSTTLKFKTTEINKYAAILFLENLELPHTERYLNSKNSKNITHTHLLSSSRQPPFISLKRALLIHFLIREGETYGHDWEGDSSSIHKMTLTITDSTLLLASSCHSMNGLEPFESAFNVQEGVVKRRKIEIWQNIFFILNLCIVELLVAATSRAYVAARYSFI